MKQGNRMPVCFLLLVLSVLFIPGCVVDTKDAKISPQISTLFSGTYKVDPYMEDHRPRTVAVLPFVDKSGSKEGAQAVRKGFYNHFSSLPFKDMEIYQVDRMLAKAGLTDPIAISKKSPQELGGILGVDGIVYGEISNFDKFFAGIYSQVAVGAEIRMYEAKTGHFLWSGQHVTRIHGGGNRHDPHRDHCHGDRRRDERARHPAFEGLRRSFPRHGQNGSRAHHCGGYATAHDHPSHAGHEGFAEKGGRRDPRGHSGDAEDAGRL